MTKKPSIIVCLLGMIPVVSRIFFPHKYLGIRKTPKDGWTRYLITIPPKEYVYYSWSLFGGGK